MIRLRKPSPAAVRDFLHAQAKLGLSYTAVGATAGTPPAEYDVDHARVRLGDGEEAFRAARAALCRWEHFRLGWVEAWPPDTPIREGEVVAVLARVLGLWWLNAARLVYVVDQEGPVTGPPSRRRASRPNSSRPLPARTPGSPSPPAEADARQFEEKRRRSLKDGAFLTLLVPPRAYLQARQELERRFPLQVVDGDWLIIDALRDAASRARVDWSLVLRTDATPHNGDWQRLMLLVGRAMPRVEEQFSAAGSTVLLVNPGLLARYDKLDLLERLRERVGRTGGLPGLWLLLPAQQPLIDGKAVPLLSPAQRVPVPEGWLENRHRAAVP